MCHDDVGSLDLYEVVAICDHLGLMGDVSLEFPFRKSPSRIFARESRERNPGSRRKKKFASIRVIRGLVIKLLAEQS